MSCLVRVNSCGKLARKSPHRKFTSSNVYLQPVVTSLHSTTHSGWESPSIQKGSVLSKRGNFLSFSKSSTKLGVVTPMVFKGVGVASVKSLNLTQPPINLDPSAQKKKSPSLLQATIPLTNQPTNQPTNHTKWLTSRRLQLQSLCPIAQGQSNPSPPNARCWLSCNPNAPGKIWESERVGYNVGSMWLYIYIQPCCFHDLSVRYTRAYRDFRDFHWSCLRVV